MQKNEIIEKAIEDNDISLLKIAVVNVCYGCMDFSDNEFDEVVRYVEQRGIKLKDQALVGELISTGKTSFVNDDFADAVYALRNNFCDERIEDVKTIGRALYGNNKKEEKAQPKPTVKREQVSLNKKKISNLEGNSHPNFKSHQQDKKNRNLIGLVAVLIVILLIIVFVEK